MDQRWCLSELMNMKAWLTTADKILNKWANQAGDVQACIPEFSAQNLHPLIARKSQCLTISIEPIGPRSFLQQNKMLSLTVNLSIEFCNL